MDIFIGSAMGGADVLTVCSQKGLGRQVDVGKRAQQTTTFLRARARATDGYGVRKWSIDGMRKKLACAASHGRAFEGWDGPDGRRRGAPMTLRVPRFFYVVTLWGESHPLTSGN